jgi:hypothetical protein
MFCAGQIAASTRKRVGSRRLISSRVRSLLKLLCRDASHFRHSWYLRQTQLPALIAIKLPLLFSRYETSAEIVRPAIVGRAIARRSPAIFAGSNVMCFAGIAKKHVEPFRTEREWE